MIEPRIQTKVAFRAWGGAVLDPGIVGRALSLDPEESYVAGEAIPDVEPPRKYGEGWVSFSSHAGVSADSPLELHAEWLLAYMEPRAALLSSWQVAGWRLRLDIIAVMNVPSGQPSRKPFDTREGFAP